MKQAPPEREWVTIHGRRILWRELIDVMDSGQLFYLIQRFREEKYHAALQTGYGIQLLTDAYVDGLDDVSEFDENLADYHLEEPKERHLPEALEELVTQMERRYRIDLSERLDRAVKRSAEIYSRMQAEREREMQRKMCVQRLVESGDKVTNPVIEQITRILTLQEKKKTGAYQVSDTQREKENLAAELWCGILIRSLNSECITHGQMLMLVQDEILDEYDISYLLNEKCHIEQDFEWYSEDFLGYDLDAETKLRIADVLEMAEPVFREILGVGE